MKRGAIIVLLFISIFLISGINGCQISKEEAAKVITELQAKYSQINDYSMNIKFSYGEHLACQKLFVKRPNKYKSLLDYGCTNNSNNIIATIFVGNLSYEQKTDPKTGTPYPIYNKMIGHFDIGKKMVEQLPLEEMITDILRPDNEITLVGEEKNTYHFKIKVPEKEAADLWVDKETYIIVKIISKIDNDIATLEIQDLKINEGISDSEFEPPKDVSVVELPLICLLPYQIGEEMNEAEIEMGKCVSLYQLPSSLGFAPDLYCDLDTFGRPQISHRCDICGCPQNNVCTIRMGEKAQIIQGPEDNPERLEADCISQQSNEEVIKVEKNWCEEYCKAKMQQEYCASRGFTMQEDNAILAKHAHCWEDPINVECPAITC